MLTRKAPLAIAAGLRLTCPTEQLILSSLHPTHHLCGRRKDLTPCSQLNQLLVLF